MWIPRPSNPIKKHPVPYIKLIYSLVHSKASASSLLALCRGQGHSTSMTPSLPQRSPLSNRETARSRSRHPVGMKQVMGHTGVSKVPPELRGGNILEKLRLQGVTFSANIQSFPDRGKEPNSALSWLHTAPISLLLYTRRAESIQHFGMRGPSSSSAGHLPLCRGASHISCAAGPEGQGLNKAPAYLSH